MLIGVEGSVGHDRDPHFDFNQSTGVSHGPVMSCETKWPPATMQAIRPQKKR